MSLSNREETCDTEETYPDSIIKGNEKALKSNDQDQSRTAVNDSINTSGSSSNSSTPPPLPTTEPPKNSDGNNLDDDIATNSTSENQTKTKIGCRETYAPSSPALGEVAKNWSRLTNGSLSSI